MFYNVTTPKFAAQAIKKAAEIGWKPLHLLNSVSNSVGGVLKPAGLDNSAGLLTTFYLKDPTDPTWKDDPGFKEWFAFMDKYYPEGDKTSSFTVYRLLVGADPDPRIGDVRRQSDAREHHEAGREHKGFHGADAAAGHHDQHQPDRFLSRSSSSRWRASTARSGSCSARS